MQGRVSSGGQEMTPKQTRKPPKRESAPDRDFDDRLLELVAERFQMLAEPMRLRLLNQLREGEKSVGELVEATGARQANVSRHLNALLTHGLVTRRKEGVFAYYRIADPAVFDLCELVCDSLEARLASRQEALSGNSA
jgi:ArsR family transcriptional regulator